jgi:glutaredoxin 3
MSDNTKIEIYGTEYCGLCTAARMLLKKKGLNYEDILVSTDAHALAEMRERSGSSSVPQIFINDKAIGGFDELYELEQSGNLGKLIGTHEDVSNKQK